MSDIRLKRIGERIAQVVKQIKEEEIKPGDRVYCTKELSDVYFLEPPDKEYFLKYYRYKQEGREFPPFTGNVKYKSLHSAINEVSIACIVKITEGKYFAEHLIKEKELNDKRNIDYCEYLARGAGFRVERQETKEGFLLKIYGDSQEKVDNFIEFCCQND